MEKVEELTKEKLKSYTDFLTVGKLKEFLDKNKLPDDAIVVVQRVQDVYYEKHHWGVYLKKGFHTYNFEKRNEDIKSGKYFDKDNYPNIKKENLVPMTEEELKETMEQYHPAFCCVNYKDDEDILFIDLHY